MDSAYGRRPRSARKRSNAHRDPYIEGTLLTGNYTNPDHWEQQRIQGVAGIDTDSLRGFALVVHSEADVIYTSIWGCPSDVPCWL